MMDRGRWARHRWNRSNGELTDLDSNQDKQYQKLLCYRYTIGQKDAIRRGRISPQMAEGQVLQRVLERPRVTRS